MEIPQIICFLFAYQKRNKATKKKFTKIMEHTNSALRELVFFVLLILLNIYINTIKSHF